MKKGPSEAGFYLSRTTEYYSLRAETYAKTKAKWTDRSGNARGGMKSTYQVQLSDSHVRAEIDVFHRMPYGIWLELRYNGKFAIINKTISSEGPKFFKTANQVMAKMFGGS